jgi:hypothetical protein
VPLFLSSTRVDVDGRMACDFQARAFQSTATEFGAEIGHDSSV